MSASPKRKSGWTIIFVAIFFIFPLKPIVAKEPIMRVLIGNVNTARFRPDSVENIFVQGISSEHRKIQSLNLVYKNNKVKYSINNNLNVYDEVILKYPPEIKRFEVINNLNIIRKTCIRYVAPLLFFMLII